jgi:hypothetical protein
LWGVTTADHIDGSGIIVNAGDALAHVWS